MATVNIVTPEFRLAFPAVFEKVTRPGGDQKFEITMLFEKSADISEMKRLAKQAVDEKWPDPAKRPANLRNPFRDGDEKEWDGYPGHVFVKATSNYQPGAVDQRLKPILNPEDLYAGCYCRAEINAFAYDRAGNQGVSFGLQNIQKLREGERFSGRSDPTNVFDPVEHGAENPENYDGFFEDDITF